MKTYATVWRWPEVYTSDPLVIWASRIIAIGIPVALVLLTIITGIPLLGWVATGVVALFLITGIILATVKMFYTEYETVESFQTREARIKQFFHGFPTLTDIPLIEYEKDEWISYGHVPPKEFLDAISTVVYKASEDAERADSYLGLEDSVGHLHATFRDPREGHWDEGLDLCKASEEGSFPITRITL
jgi:hypothetical protein